MARIGFVGAGRMGRPMVDRLRAAGHDVRVWARSEQARATLVEAGVPVVDAAAEVGADVDALLVCVYSDDQVRAACLAGDVLAKVPSGAAVVVHTTGSPATVTDIAAAVADRGIDVIDAPVSGGPREIAAGRITLFLGGDAAAVDRLRPVLGAYGDPILHVGGLGAGQRVKLVNNAVFTAQIGLLAAAAKLGTDLGVDEATLLNAMTHGSSASAALTMAAGRGSVAGFAVSAHHFLVKDVAVARAVIGELGADLGVLDAAIAHLPAPPPQ